MGKTVRLSHCPSDSLTALGPQTLSLLSSSFSQTLSPLSSLFPPTLSPLSTLRLSRCSCPSDSKDALGPQTFLFLSYLRLSHRSTQYATIFRRHHLQAAATNSP